MKVTYQKKIPKSRLRETSECGTVYSLTWDAICEAVSDYRRKRGWDKAGGWDTVKTPIKSVHVTDREITFVHGNE